MLICGRVGRCSPPRSRNRVEALFDRGSQSSRGRISGTLDGPLPSANLFQKVLAADLMMEADEAGILGGHANVIDCAARAETFRYQSRISGYDGRFVANIDNGDPA